MRISSVFLNMGKIIINMPNYNIIMQMYIIYLVAIFLRWLATFLVLLQVGFLVPLRARGKFSRRNR